MCRPADLGMLQYYLVMCVVMCVVMCAPADLGMLQYCLEKNVAVFCHGSVLGGFLRCVCVRERARARAR